MTSPANVALLVVGAVGFSVVSKIATFFTPGVSAAEYSALDTLSRQLDRCGPEHLTCPACPPLPISVVDLWTFVALVVVLPVLASAWTLYASHRLSERSFARTGGGGSRSEDSGQRGSASSYVVTPATRGGRRTSRPAIASGDDDGAVDGRFLEFN